MSVAAEPLAGTAPLETQGDLAEQMVAGIDRFLLAKSMRRSSGLRHRKRDVSSQPITPLRRSRTASDWPRLLVQPTRPVPAIEYMATTSEPALVGRGEQFEAFAVRWPVVRGVTSEGLLLVPTRPATIDIVALPDADQTPEMLAGLCRALSPRRNSPMCLAESGCRVLVPTLIDRFDLLDRGGRPAADQSAACEFLYRPAFEMGRHIIGYEVQKVLARSIGSRPRRRAKNAPSAWSATAKVGCCPCIRGARPANRRGLGQRLLRRSRAGLGRADLSQRLWPARAIRRCRAGRPDRAAGAGDRSLPRAGSRRAARAKRGKRPCGARPADDTQAGQRTGGSRSSAQARSRYYAATCAGAGRQRGRRRPAGERCVLASF